MDDKQIWRCHCGKRVEVLTDDNLGDCGCDDPVYGPEYYRMTIATADLLDERDKEYKDLSLCHQSSTNRVTGLKHSVERLISALDLCRDRFADYVASHEAKLRRLRAPEEPSTPVCVDGEASLLAKVSRNREMARICDAAVLKARASLL